MSVGFCPDTITEYAQSARGRTKLIVGNYVFLKQKVLFLIMVQFVENAVIVKALKAKTNVLKIIQSTIEHTHAGDATAV